MRDFSVRLMRSGDEPFVYRAWLEGYWQHFPGNVVMPKGEFMQRWHMMIERILADRRTVTVVAHIDGEPDILLGFACLMGDLNCGLGVHWAYVKQAFRGMGVCSEMLRVPILQTIISHWPGRDREGWHYVPELLKDYT